MTPSIRNRWYLPADGYGYLQLSMVTYGSLLLFHGKWTCIKLNPKWVAERAKHSGRKICHEMKGS